MICCFIYPHCLWVLCWYFFLYALLYVLSSFATILTRKRELVALLFVFRMSCYCKCSVALPRGVRGDLQCVIEIAWSYSLTFQLCAYQRLCWTTKLMETTWSHSFRNLTYTVRLILIITLFSLFKKNIITINYYYLIITKKKAIISVDIISKLQYTLFCFSNF